MMTNAEVPTATTAALVREFAAIKVRLAIHTERTPDMAGRFGPLGLVVAELRARGVLD